MSACTLKPEEHFIKNEPYYQPLGDEIEVFEAALAKVAGIAKGAYRLR